MLEYLFTERYPDGKVLYQPYQFHISLLLTYAQLNHCKCHGGISMNRCIYSKSGHRTTIGICTILLCTFISLLIISPGFTSAATHAKTVRGYVWDSVGRDIEGASVLINIKDGESIVSSDSDTTDANGFYSVIFNDFEWDIGNTIEVISMYESSEEINSTVADDSFVQWVNVSYTFEIPQFGGGMGLLIAGGFLGAIAIASFTRRKK